MASVTVSDKFKALANGLTRQVETQAHIYDYVSSRKEWRYGRTYNDTSGIVSWTITGGKQTGAFEIGQTICKSLEIQFQRGAKISGNARIDIEIRFINPADLTDASEWLLLGQFYADKISVSETSGIKKVVAMDYMLWLEKSYRTEMSYPLPPSLILDDLAEQAGFELAEGLSVFNDPAVGSFPYKGQSSLGLRILYSRRQILGFIASLQAGNAYFTRDGYLQFTTYHKNPNAIDVSRCYNMTSSGADYNIKNVIWSEAGGENASTIEDGYRYVFFTNPLDIGQNKYNALQQIKSVLVGKNVRQISIEKQGTGLYEIGETVTIIDNDEEYDIIISGIRYSMTNGGFRETLYSVAQSESESNYTDSAVNSSAGGNNSITSILYQFNENPLVLSAENQELFSMQFSSVSNAVAVVAATLNPSVAVQGDITASVFVDQKLYGEFTDVVELGANVFTVVCPLVGLPNGGHVLSLQVKGTATAEFAAVRNYMTLFANGVATEAGFSGMLELEQEAGLMVVTDDMPQIIFADVREILDIDFNGEPAITFTQSVRDMIISDDTEVEMLNANGYVGGKYVALIDSELKVLYDADGLRLLAKRQ